jgi:hypothetical protein
MGKVTKNEPGSFPGYTLFVSKGPRILMIDMNGNLVHQWYMPFKNVWSDPPPNFKPRSDHDVHFANFYVFPNGDVLAMYINNFKSPNGSGIIKMDKDSNILWKYLDIMHHKMHVADNGNIYALRFNPIPKMLLNMPLLKDIPSQDSIVILSPQGKELESIPITEAFRDTPYEQLLYAPTWRDWDLVHSNAVVPLEARMADKFPYFKTGQILLSMRNYSALAVIDPDTKKVVWAIKGIWHTQHDAKFMPNGNIMVFDNDGFNDQTTPYSRILMFNPITQAIDWFYEGDKEHPFYTAIRGETQVLPNGNLLVLEATDCRIFEITPDKKIVWDYKLAQRIGYNEATFLKSSAPASVH